MDPGVLVWPYTAGQCKWYKFWANITSGIPQPQGSVLGPILFVLYINYIPENIVSNVYMIADDTNIFITYTTERFLLFNILVK